MKKWILGFLLFLVFVPVLLLIFRKDNVVSRQEAIDLCESSYSKYYNWEDIEVHYTDQGAGDTVIFMIHGFGGSHKNFSVIAEELREDYRIICIDLPAFGLSEVPKIDLKNDELFAYYQRFIRSSIDFLDLKYYHLMGNSMGGWIAWDLAAESDSNLLSLTLLNSAGFGMEKVKGSATSWMTGPFGGFIFKKGVPFRMSKSNAERCFSDDSKINIDRVEKNYFMLNKEGTFSWMLQMASSTVLPDTALIAQINCPSLVLWGDDDQIVPVDHADKFDALLPNSKKIIYEKCGHTPQMEYPKQVAGDWINFVREI